MLIGPALNVEPVQTSGLNGDHDSNICEVFVALPAKLLDDNIFGSWNYSFDLLVWERKPASPCESLLVVWVFA
jgi:hypothetical protein